MKSVLAEYFRQGETSRRERVGLEAEHFILNRVSGMPMPYSEIARMLEKIKGQYDRAVYEEGNLIQLENDQALVTLEPGCQTELSFACTSDLKAVGQWYEKAISPIVQFADEDGYDVVCSGGLPTEDPNNVPRILKERYYFMDRWFQDHGSRGHEMMKGTASIHISVDYENEQDFVDKYRMANILHPLFAFLMSNTPRYKGRPNVDVLLRDSIWMNTDPARTGIIPGLFDDDFGYETYARWLESIPIITMKTDEGYIDAGDMTIKEAMEVWGTDDKKIAHYLSMAFPNIRLKRFIEIRSADMVPLPWMMGYAALIKGLFYDRESIQKYKGLTKDEQDIVKAADSLRKDGWDARVYGTKAGLLLRDLIAAARKSLPESEMGLLDPLEELVRNDNHIYETENGKRMEVLHS